MARLAPKGTYIIADNVHIWYDHRSDNIHITCNDSDFGPNGFHMTAKKGTASDRNMRAAMAAHGCGPDAQQDAAALAEQAAAAAQLAAAISDGKLDGHLDVIDAAIQDRRQAY